MTMMPSSSTNNKRSSSSSSPSLPVDKSIKDDCSTLKKNDDFMDRLRALRGETEGSTPLMMGSSTCSRQTTEGRGNEAVFSSNIALKNALRKASDICNMSSHSTSNQTAAVDDCCHHQQQHLHEEEWYTHHFLSLQRLNLEILEHHLAGNAVDDYNDIDMNRTSNGNGEQNIMNATSTIDALRANHEHIRILLDLWNDMPEEEENVHPHQQQHHRKEETLFELLQLTGETFLYYYDDRNSNDDDESCTGSIMEDDVVNDVDKEVDEQNTSAELYLDLAIKLLHHALNICRVINSSSSSIGSVTAINVSQMRMLKTRMELGMAYYKRGGSSSMNPESMEHLQMAHSFGKELFHKYRTRKFQQQYYKHNYQTKDDVVTTTNYIDDEHDHHYHEILTRMIIICTTLGELYTSTGAFESAIYMFQQTTNYFDYNVLQLEDFEEMLRLMNKVGKLALMLTEKENKQNKDAAPVEDAVLPMRTSIIEYVKLGVILQENHLDDGQQLNSDEEKEVLVPSLMILRDLYLRHGDHESATVLSTRIQAITSSSNNDSTNISNHTN